MYPLLREICRGGRSGGGRALRSLTPYLSLGVDVGDEESDVFLVHVRSVLDQRKRAVYVLREDAWV